MIKVLYITHRVPYPLNKGERIRCAHILRRISEVASVALISLADEPVHPDAYEFLKRYTFSYQVIPLGKVGRYLRMISGLVTGRSLTESAFAAKRVKRAISNLLSHNNYDVILVSSSGLYGLLPQRLDTMRLIVDMMDVDSRKWLAYAETSFWGRIIYQREAQLVRNLEVKILGNSEAVIVTTPRELNFLSLDCTKNKCLVVGNGVDCDYFRAQTFPSRYLNDLAFVGALDYWPNIDAIEWFVNTVWPQVLHRVPQSVLHIIGRRPTNRVQRLVKCAHVKLHGDVADIRPYMQQCGIAVFPLRLVFGIPNKVLEALAMGRLCIVPPEIANVIGGCPNVHYLVARNPQEWLDQICLMHQHPNMADQIARNGRIFVANKYEWHEQLAPLLHLISQHRPPCSVSRYI